MLPQRREGAEVIGIGGTMGWALVGGSAGRMLGLNLNGKVQTQTLSMYVTQEECDMGLKSFRF